MIKQLHCERGNKTLLSPKQRRARWNSEERRTYPECKKPLSWSNFQVDHILAHSRGGRTTFRNPRLTCGRCNASKGARRRTRRAA